MDITLKEKTSKMVKTFIVEHEGYKATVNLTVNGGKIENLRGNVMPVDQDENQAYNCPSYHAYKRNEKWCTEVSGVANDEHDIVSDICVAIVDKVVADYEVVEPVAAAE